MEEVLIGALCGAIGQFIVCPDTCLWGRLIIFTCFFAGGCETVEAIADIWDEHVKGWR